MINELSTKDLMNVTTVFPILAECLPMCKGFIRFDATELHGLSEEYVEIMKDQGSCVQVLKYKGSTMQLFPCSQDIMTLVSPFAHLKSVAFSRPNIIYSLDFLPKLPASVTILQLDDMISISATEFIMYLPTMASQLEKLALTNNAQLTCYDLVNILQHFERLEALDLRATEYLSAGTTATILRYCSNLQQFYLTTRLRFRDSRTWLNIVECEYPHVEFSQDVYDDLKTHRWLLEMIYLESSSDSD